MSGIIATVWYSKCCDDDMKHESRKTFSEECDEMRCPTQKKSRTRGVERRELHINPPTRSNHTVHPLLILPHDLLLLIHNPLRGRLHRQRTRRITRESRRWLLCRSGVRVRGRRERSRVPSPTGRILSFSLDDKFESFPVHIYLFIIFRSDGVSYREVRVSEPVKDKRKKKNKKTNLGP